MSRKVLDGRICQVLRLRGFAASARQAVLKRRSPTLVTDTGEPVSPKLARSASEGGAPFPRRRINQRSEAREPRRWRPVADL